MRISVAQQFFVRRLVVVCNFFNSQSISFSIIERFIVLVQCRMYSFHENGNRPAALFYIIIIPFIHSSLYFVVNRALSFSLLSSIGGRRSVFFFLTLNTPKSVEHPKTTPSAIWLRSSANIISRITK